MKEQMPVSNERDPGVAIASQRPNARITGRPFQAPDAANPGPVRRFYPLEGEPGDGTAGFDSIAEAVNQNQDRI